MQGPTGHLAAGANEAFYRERYILREMLHREPGAKIVRNTVKTTAIHNPRTTGLRRSVILQPHPVDKFRLAGQIDIVSA